MHAIPGAIPARSTGAESQWTSRLAFAAVAIGSLLLIAGPVAAYESLPAPPVYRWVNAPADFVIANEAPLGASAPVPFSTAGSKATSVVTGDGQATAVLPETAITSGPVSLNVNPIATTKLPGLPGDLVFEGNAYRIDATTTSGPASLAKPATIVLRFPITATKLLRLDAGRWRTLKATLVPGSLTVYGDTDALGTFVAAGPHDPPGRRPPWIPFAAGAALAAVALGHATRYAFRTPA